MATILYPSAQFSFFPWQMSFTWPLWMAQLASWCAVLTMPDFSSVLGVKCQGSDMGADNLYAIKFFTKKGAFWGSLVIFGILYIISKTQRKRHCVQAIAATFSLLSMLFAKSAFVAVAFTSHAGGEFNDGAMSIDSMPSIHSGARNTDGSGNFLIMGFTLVLLFVVLIPLFYYRKLSAGSKTGAYVNTDGAGNTIICVGYLLWSQQTSQRQDWYYSLFKPYAWYFEFT